jgi:hypothetical protein
MLITSTVQGELSDHILNYCPDVVFFKLVITISNNIHPLDIHRLLALTNMRSWKNFIIIWERMIKNLAEFAMQKKRMLYPK